MTVGYLSLIILRNRPSEIGLEDFDSSVDENISTLYKNDGKTDEDTSSLSSIDSESEDEEEELGALQRTKLYLNYPYFISICLSFFIVTLIKTLMSDWSQVYLIKSIRVDHYNGLRISIFIEILIYFNRSSFLSFLFCVTFRTERNNWLCRLWDSNRLHLLASIDG